MFIKYFSEMNNVKNIWIELIDWILSRLIENYRLKLEINFSKALYFYKFSEKDN